MLPIKHYYLAFSRMKGHHGKDGPYTPCKPDNVWTGCKFRPMLCECCMIYWPNGVWYTDPMVYDTLTQCCPIHWDQIVWCIGSMLCKLCHQCCAIHWPNVVGFIGPIFYDSLAHICVIYGLVLYAPLIWCCVISWLKSVWSFGPMLCPMFNNHWSQIVCCILYVVWCSGWMLHDPLTQYYVIQWANSTVKTYRANGNLFHQDRKL